MSLRNFHYEIFYSAMRLFTYKHKSKNFHEEIKRSLVIAQIFGLLPVKGITDKTCDKLLFSWKAKRMLMAYVVISGMCGLAVMSFYRTWKRGFDTHNFGGFAFLATSCCITIVFLILATKWPELIKYWCGVDSSLIVYLQNENLVRKFDIILGILLTAASIEHGLSIINGFEVTGKSSSKGRTRIEQYFHLNYPYVFDFVPFSAPLAAACVLLNVCGVFSWNFLDAFLIILSTALGSRFRQVNAKIISATQARVDSKFHWLKLREDYNKICNLCQMVDSNISFLILVSFGTNMYFIVAQLYGIFAISDVVNGYFFFSFGMLLLRTVAVTLFASKINDESRKPLSHLLSISSQSYNAEIERFILQIYCQPTALTGHGFFIITRGLLFSMASAIVTYELFLIQSHVSVYVGNN